MFFNLKLCFKIIFIVLSVFTLVYASSTDTAATKGKIFPVVFSGDTLFYVGTNLGPFTPEQRVTAIEEKLNSILDEDKNPASIDTENVNNISNIRLGSEVIMSLTDQDAEVMGKARNELAVEYRDVIRSVLKKNVELFSSKNLIISFVKIFIAFILLVLLFWIMKRIFPVSYEKLESWEGVIIKSVRIRSIEIISATHLSAIFIVLLKLIRLAISLACLYFFVVFSIAHLPWTRGVNIKPIFGGALLAVMITVAAYTLLNGLSSFFKVMDKKTTEWRGTIIKSVRVKNLEILSDSRIIDSLKFLIKLGRFISFILLAYFYFTILFSLFAFTRTWASKLFGYIINPIGKILFSFIHYLPNLFTIIVILFITRYVIKFIKFIFGEIGSSTVAFPKFPAEWAEPTFKIIRFLILVFAAIVIFPYLPGSNSPIFRGISIFLGILFSFGSTSAVSNIVGGTVLTYMRPFKIGDRVKIADTVGDVIEKTLLVTRVRTIKNVDITIPNAMVLGSHIINYSSSAKKEGLILHTSITIGYDSPWRQIHELLYAAASATNNVLKEPKPFVLQTALDDFYVNYELNVYTDKPNEMANIYSELHQNIQDKFNEAGVEIMSPHVSSLRDGNKIKIPDEYVPKDYKIPAFKFSPLGNIFEKPGNKNSSE